MTITAAKLAVEFEATGIPETSRAIDQMNQKVDRAGDAGKAAGAGLLAAGAAGLAAFGKGLGLVTDFESRMSGLGAVTGLTGDSLKRLDDLALLIGKNTSFSASTAADALAELAKAGVGVEDILKGAGVGATDLAAAAGVEVPEAARIMSNALNVFRLSGDQASRVADVLAAASNKSAADVGELGYALAQGGTVAAQFGLSLEETVGAMALFADYGLRGSDAGTSLKSGLLALLSPTKAQREQMNALNLSVFDAQGNFIGLEGLAGTLQSRMSGLTEEQRNTALAVLFGSDAVRAASILYRAGAEGVADYTGAVNDTGAASDMAAARLDNLSGDLEELSGSVETVAIKFLRFSQGPLRGLVQQGTAAVNWLGDLNPRMQQAIAIGGLLASAAAALAGGWALFGDKILLAVRGFALLTPPLLLITALVAGLWLAWQRNFGGIQELTRRVVDAVGATLGRMAQFFQAAKSRGLDPFRLAMRTLIVGLGERLGENHPVINFLKGVLRNGERLADWITNDGLPTITGIFDALREGDWRNAGDLFGGLVEDLRGGWDRTIGPFLAEMLTFGGRVLQNIMAGLRGVNWDAFGTDVNRGLQATLGVLGQLGGWVLDRVRAVNWDHVRATLETGARIAVFGVIAGARNGLTALGQFGGWVGERLGEVDWETLKTALLTRGQEIASRFVGGFTERFPVLIDWLTTSGLPGLVEELVVGGANVIAGFVKGLTDHWPAIQDFFTTILIPGIVGLLLIGPTLLVAAGIGIITGLLNGLKRVWDGGLSAWMGERQAAIFAFFNNASEWLLTRGQEISDGLLRGMQNLWSQQIAPWFIGRKDAILQGISSAGDWLLDRGREVVQGLLDGATEKWRALQTWLAGRKAAIVAAIPSPGTILTDMGRSIMQGLWNGFSAKWREFTGWFEDQIAKLPSIPNPLDALAGDPDKHRGLGAGGRRGDELDIEPRALGGPVWAGRAYWVGEREPELFVPRVSGHVYTARDAARMATPPPARAAVGAAGGGTVIQQTNHITMSLQEVQELIEAARFVRDLDETRTLYLGAT